MQIMWEQDVECVPSWIATVAAKNGPTDFTLSHSHIDNGHWLLTIGYGPARVERRFFTHPELPISTSFEEARIYVLRLMATDTEIMGMLEVSS